jgi:hypothetical protein
MSKDVYKNYLHDLGYILRENAIKAKEDIRAAKDPEDQALRQGFRMAYYDVVTIMQQQQIGFDEVSDSDLAFEGFDPDRDVLVG